MLAMTKRFVPAAVLGLAFASAGQARAASIVDQQYGPPPGNFGSSIPFNSVIGQSFTPALGGIDFAIFILADFSGNPGLPGTYRAEVHAGVNGALLGSSDPVSFPAGFGGGTMNPVDPVEFDFAATIALTPGSTYSLTLVRLDSNSNFFLIGQFPGGYAGGSGILRGTTSNDDFFFSEGLRGAAVPEPPTLAGAATGLLMLAGYAWRRRRRAAA